MKKKFLYLCSTPYQLFVIINIKKQYFQDIKSDILFTDAVKDFLNNINLKEIKKFFSNVYFCDIYEYARKNINQFDVNVPYNILKQYVLNYVDLYYSEYTDIFFSNAHIWVSYFIKALEDKSNASISVHYFDDGIFSYINFDKYVFKTYGIRISDAFLFRNNLVCVDYGIPIYQVPLELNGNYGAKKFFLLNREIKFQLENTKYLLLEHHFSNKLFYKLEDDIFNKIWSLKEDVIIKPHHRRKKRNKSEIPILNTLVPIELLSQLFLKNEIYIITVFSTGAIFAPLVRQKDTSIIFLYRLFRNYFSVQEYLQMEKFVANYTLMTEKKYKIYIPNDEEDLFDKILL